MKIVLVRCFLLLCLYGTRVQSKPQITKLFPVQELADYHRQIGDKVKPLDKFLGKLRATYNLVLQKPEDTSNVERILAKDAPNPELEALKTIWSNRIHRRIENKTILPEGRSLRDDEMSLNAKEDRLNDIRPFEYLQPLEPLAPLAPLELQDEMDENTDRNVESVAPGTNLGLPVALSRQLVEWLGSLLSLTFGVYSKLARAIHGNTTIAEA